MVNNFDRIFAEIAARAPLGELPGLASERLIELLLGAVDLEDRNRIRSISRINATLEERVRAVALEARRAAADDKEERSEGRPVGKLPEEEGGV